ncbi:MAG: anti-sigma factor [Pyrinomonadaceae bacterium]|nr:anti-sigma factor [Pyrinomonadaceae bacterium]
MLAAHALGALDSEEARRVEEHLEACAECRAELEVWRDTTSALAYTVAPAEPSPQLRSRILESVRASSAQPKIAGETKKAASSSSNVIAFQRSNLSRAQRFGAIAATLAVITLAAALFIALLRLREVRRELARNQAAVESLAKQVAQEREARELLTSPQSQNAQLNGTNMAPEARGQLVFDQRTGHAMLFAYNLPPVPAGKAYQLWFISGGKVMPGKVFMPDRDGRAMINEQVPVNNLDSKPVFAVTLEPSGGVQVATGEKYLLSPSS